MRTREGLAVARAAGRLRGREPELTSRREAHLIDIYRAGGKTTTDLAHPSSVGRSTVYRALERASAETTTAEAVSTEEPDPHPSHEADVS